MKISWKFAACTTFIVHLCLLRRVYVANTEELLVFFVTLSPPLLQDDTVERILRETYHAKPPFNRRILCISPIQVKTELAFLNRVNNFYLALRILELVHKNELLLYLVRAHGRVWPSAIFNNGDARICGFFAENTNALPDLERKKKKILPNPFTYSAKRDQNIINTLL